VPKINVAEMPFSYEKMSEREKEKVIDEWMNLYSRNVYLLAYTYVKDQGIAEDISQEVFIKCYKNLGQFRGEANIKSWIYRITVNTAKDTLKSKNFNILKFPKTFFENIKKSASSEEVFVEQDSNEALLQTVFRLPTKYREVIFLHYFEEQKIDDIALILYVNTNTVKTRLSRARALLKDQLNKAKGDDGVGKRF
jgi:RNA polymerase sigma-70 factor, ECF subfamily